MSNSVFKEFLLILLAIVIAIIFVPLQKVADSLFSLSLVLTVNEWIGIGLLIIIIWIILRFLTRIDMTSKKEQVDLITGLIQQQSSQIQQYIREFVINMPSKDDINKLTLAIEKLTEKINKIEK
jgi:hypothetical protein